jgi:hypothetical protein
MALIDCIDCIDAYTTTRQRSATYGFAMMQPANPNLLLDVRMAHAIGLILSRLIRERTDFGVYFDYDNEATVAVYQDRAEWPTREYKLILNPHNGQVHMHASTPEPPSKPDHEPPAGTAQP